MKFDPGILVYVIFLAIILYSNHLKKRKQAKEREALARKIGLPPSERSQEPATQGAPSQLPDIDQWLDTLWGKKKPQPVPPALPARKSLHEQRREKELQAQRVGSTSIAPARGAVAQQSVPTIGRRVPIDAARFKTREDLRRAIVARVVFAPPKALE